MENSINSSWPSSGLITFKQVAQEFGISVRTLHRRFKDGSITLTCIHIGRGRQRFFRKTEVLNWIENEFARASQFNGDNYDSQSSSESLQLSFPL